MGNTKQVKDQYIRKVYDLKGSLANREVKIPKDKTQEHVALFESCFKNTSCLKDLNLLNFLKHEVFLKFGARQTKEILEKMMKDVVLLSNFGLMDYSLLFVVAFNKDYVARNGHEFKFEDDKLEKERNHSKRIQNFKSVGVDGLLKPIQLNENYSSYLSKSESVTFSSLFDLKTPTRKKRTFEE